MRQGSELGKGRPKDSGNGRFHVSDQPRHQRARSDMCQNSTVEQDDIGFQKHEAKTQNTDYKMKSREPQPCISRYTS